MTVILKSFSIDENDSRLTGLGICRLEGLTDLVVIAGRNGAGKSRLLNLVEQKLSNLHPSARMPVNVEELRLRVKDLESRIKDLESPIDGAVPGRLPTLRNELETVNGELMRAHQTEITAPYSNIVRISDGVSPVEPVASANVGQMASSQPQGSRDFDFQGGTKRSKRALQAIVYSYRDVTHPQSKAAEDYKRDVISRFDFAKKLTLEILGSELNYDEKFVATLFGFPLDGAKLSPGQQRLLSLCVVLLEKEVYTDQCLIIIDEVEQFLHPSACIEFVSRIQKVLPNSQILATTHSLPFSASIDLDKLWFMKDGTISKVGYNVAEVAEGLMGGAENVENLRRFIALPDELALSEFAAECLLEPESIEFKRSDPQVEQLISELGKICGDGERRHRILDFGAGKGRVAGLLSTQTGANCERLSDQFEYFAYNLPESKDRSECLANLISICSSPEGYYIEDRAQLNEIFAQEKADVVLLCNVLHEIPPGEWPRIFKTIGGILSTEGIILIVEDLQMRVGENPYFEGFCLLHERALRILCVDIDEKQIGVGYRSYHGEANRLVCYVVPKVSLDRINLETISAAVSCVKKYSKDRIYDLRKRAETDVVSGRLHALYLSLFANSELILENLSD